MSIGNTKDQGNKGNNFPYQLRTLQLLSSINDGIAALSGVDYETRTSTYQAIANGAGYSIGDIIVRYDIIDVATSTLASTIWYNQTLQTTIAAPAPGDLTPISAPSSVTVLNGPLGAAVNIQDGGNSITVDANDLDIRDLTFATDSVNVSGSSVTVTAIDLDIRDLSHLQDSVKIGDGSDFLDINADGSLNTNLRDGSGTPITSTGGALDVNILSGVTLDVNLSYLNDTVQIYGSDTTLPIATDASGNLQIDVLSQPALTFATDTVDVSGSSVSVSNFPVTQDVNIVSAVTLDVSGSNVNAVVTATDLDIRNLTFVDDKVDVSGSSVKLQDGSGNNITSTANALDVNIKSGITLDVTLDKTNDTVQVYGSDLTAPIATDTSGHLQVDILTIPEVEIKNDAGNPIPVSGTVTVNQPVAVTDNGGSLTVDATDLDIRDLTFASDKVDVSNSINVEVVQAVHDDLNVNANIQVGDVDVSNLNPVPISDAGGSITVDGTVALDAPTLTALENITVQNGAGASAVNIQDGGNSITIDSTQLDVLLSSRASEATLGQVQTNTLNTVNSLTTANTTLNNTYNELIDQGNTLDTIDADTSVLATPVTGLAVAMIRSSLAAQSVAAGKRSVAIFNAGNATGTVLGANLLPGETVSFSADGLRDTLASISYDASGTDFLITTVG